MINILIPSMGKSMFFKDSFFPKPLIEIEGKTILERLIENYDSLNNKRFIFVFDKKDCLEFHLDDSAKILADPNLSIISLENQTKGALCTCLMAIEYINNEEPLIIANCDQTLEVDYAEVVDYFRNENDTAGVITFDSVHPRWSYAKIRDGYVVETAEKRPLSKHAIAGVYYFEHGHDFIEAAKKTILKENQINGAYYISSSINEVILSGARVGFYEVSRERYNSFYSPEKIKEYEDKIRKKNEVF